MSDWQPIETAPTDGTKVRVLNDEGQEDRAYWKPFTLFLEPVVPLRGLYNESGEWDAEKGLGPFTHWKQEDA